MTEKEFNELRKKELRKCYHDISYLARKYSYINHPIRGPILFDLYPFQVDVIKELSDNRFNVILKSRQIGLSTVVAFYAFHKMFFNPGSKVAVIATKKETAKEIVEKVRLVYSGLPGIIVGYEKRKSGELIKTPLEVDNKLELKLKNGSSIQAFSASENAARSAAATLLIIDEAAFIEGIDDIYTAAWPTISTGGSVVILSTPNGTAGVGEFFYRICEEARLKQNGYNYIRLPWEVLPTRTQRWRDEQDVIFGKKKAKQEYDAEFLSTGDTFIEADDLTYIEKKCVESPIMMSDWEDSSLNREWIWEKPVQNRGYTIVVDTGQGDGGDDSTISVYDNETCNLVAEIAADNLPPKKLAPLAIQLAVRYNNALIVPERTGLGLATCQEFTRDEYSYYPHVYKGIVGEATKDFEQFLRIDDEDRKVVGFSTNTATRPIALSKLKTMIEETICDPDNPSPPKMIRSARKMIQYRSFIWKNGKAQSAKRKKDDLVISDAIFCTVREISIAYRSKKIEHDIQTLSAIQVKRPYSQLMNLSHTLGYGTPTNHYGAFSSNPFEMRTGNIVEDLSWMYPPEYQQKIKEAREKGYI